MKVINLEKVSKAKRSRIILEYCGGQYGGREAFSIGGIGIGGLHYLNGAELVDEQKKGESLAANLEIFKEGYGVYLRENNGNYLLLIHHTEILNISFYKEEDRIKQKEGFSLFKSCMSRGIPYHYSKLMLVDDEIVELYKPKLKMITTALDEINFVCSRKNPLKIKRYFESLNLGDKFIHDYKTFAAQ